jgi:UDP:flavonoid glycosyltransferase YjiC (YdhE family)
MGGGYGHVHRILPLADSLAAAGLDVTLALRHRETGQALLAGRSHRLVEAPPLPLAPAQPVRLESWADLLFNGGYGTAAAATQRIGQWAALLRDARIDLVVGDFAPGAMLGAQVAGLPCIAFGSGWSLPPATTPLPAIRFWAPPAPGVLETAEARLLAALNPALGALGRAPLDSLAALFRQAETNLCCFPEFDHYPARGAADYFGPLYQTGEGGPAQWPAGAGPRCFVYANNAHPARPALLAALGRLGWPTVLHLRGAAAGDAGRLPGTLWLAPGPLRLDRILAERPIVVCQGLQTHAAALVAGCPVLAMPEHLEQTGFVNRLLPQGLCLALPPQASEAEASTALRTLHETPAYRARAEAFAAHYHGYEPGLALDAVTEACLEKLG